MDNQLTIGGVFTDPNEVKRMQQAMKRRPMNMDYSPRPKRAPRRYHPSIVAHRLPPR